MNKAKVRIKRRNDLADYTWEVILPGENWTLTIPRYPDAEKAVCGCGQSDCEHIQIVLRAFYSPYHPLRKAESTGG